MMGKQAGRTLRCGDNAGCRPEARATTRSQELMRTEVRH